ncbi:MAG: type VI secretion system protein TssA [Bacteroidota bacterium]
MSDSPDTPVADAPAEEAASAEEAAVENVRSPFLQALSEPISDASPTGIKVRYEDSFQQLKGEVDKIGSGSGGADYDLIVSLAQSILTTESKDLTVTYYLTLGFMRTQGQEGLAEGIGALRVLSDTFWDGLHPKKTKARSKVLQLFAERVTAHLEDTTPKPDDRPALESVQSDLEALQAFYTESMGPDAPVLSRVARLVRDTLKKIPKPKPPEPVQAAPSPTEATAAPESTPPAASTSSATPQAAAAPASAATLTAAVPSGPIASTSDAAVTVLKAASFLREADLTNPLPYLLARSVRWGMLKQTPPKLPNAPLDKRRTYLEGLLQKGEYQALVENGERDFTKAPFYFWLDLQRLVAAALERLGPAYRQAQLAVEGAAAGLMHRLPDLSTLSFADGVPAADPLTAEWLDGLAASGGDTADGTGSGDAEVLEAYDAARQTLAGGDLNGALQQFRAAPVGSAARAQFVRDLYAADLCAKGKAPDIALSILGHLERHVEAHNLGAWEPALASQFWALQHTCLTQLLPKAPAAEKAALQERTRHAFAELSALDPVAALRYRS